MRRTPGWTDVALVALLGVAACADASSSGTAGQGGGVATPRGGSSPDLAAPFVLGTGRAPTSGR